MHILLHTVSLIPYRISSQKTWENRNELSKGFPVRQLHAQSIHPLTMAEARGRRYSDLDPTLPPHIGIPLFFDIWKRQEPLRFPSGICRRGLNRGKMHVPEGNKRDGTLPFNCCHFAESSILAGIGESA